MAEQRPYRVEFLGPARRAISERVLEAVAAAVLEFCDGALIESPHLIGKPLFGSLAGCHGTRRATYRIVYLIDDDKGVVQVPDVAHRRDIYRPADSSRDLHNRPSHGHPRP